VCADNSVQRYRLACARDAEKRKSKKEGEAIGNGYLAKAKLDFYSGQVLIKFGKLEENLGERRHHPRATTTAYSCLPLRGFPLVSHRLQSLHTVLFSLSTLGAEKTR